MIDLILTFFAGLIIGIGVCLRVFLWKLRHDKRSLKCACKHHLSFHEGQGGCRYNDGYGDGCGCRRFISKSMTLNQALFGGELN